ncbi:MAG: APC family permease [Campylobacterota bacterium]|nr:APC family permease [Campylobacterota bacterium]
MDNKNNKVKLKREISLSLLVLYGLGNIIGAGIYALIGEISGISGYFIPISFLLACIIVLFTALSYAELSSRYPLSAGVAIYIDKAFNNKKLTTFMGLLVALNGMLFAATIVHGFNGYISVLVGIPEYISSFLILLTLSSIAIWGISQSVKIAAFLTILESLGLLLIIFVGIDYLPKTDVVLRDFLPSFEFSVYNAIILGAFLAFFAFTGFEDIVTISEEVKDPSRIVPKAIIISLIIATIIYILITFFSIIIVEPQILAKSSAPLDVVYKTASNSESNILGTIGTLAMINGALIQIIMVSRIFFGMSKEGWLPSFFNKLDKSTHTPVIATIIVTIIVYISTTWLPLLTLAELTSFVIFIIFSIVNFALIKIKLSSDKIENIFTIPIWVPAVGIVLNIFMMIIYLLN